MLIINEKNLIQKICIRLKVIKKGSINKFKEIK